MLIANEFYLKTVADLNEYLDKSCLCIKFSLFQLNINMTVTHRHQTSKKSTPSFDSDINFARTMLKGASVDVLNRFLSKYKLDYAMFDYNDKIISQIIDEKMANKTKT